MTLSNTKNLDHWYGRHPAIQMPGVELGDFDHWLGRQPLSLLAGPGLVSPAWQDEQDFEVSYGGWAVGGGGSTGTSVRSTARPRSGSWSAKHTTPAIIYENAVISELYPWTTNVKTVDLWYEFPAGDADCHTIEVSMEGWSGTEQHLSSFQHKNDPGFPQLLGWQRWVTGAWTPISGGDVVVSQGVKHHLQLAVDFNKQEYVYLKDDGTVYDLTGLAYAPPTLNGASSSFIVAVHLWTQTAAAVSMYVDDIRVGELVTAAANLPGSLLSGGRLKSLVHGALAR